MSTTGALLLVAGVQVAGALAHWEDDINPTCRANQLDKGVYPPSDPIPANIGKFDITTDPTTAKTFSKVGGGAIFCGAHDMGGTGDVFFLGGRVFNPNQGEIPRCARPNPPVSLCDANRNGKVDTFENVPDNSYAGSTVADAYCNDDTYCYGGYYSADNATDTVVQYDTSSPYGKPPYNGNFCLDNDKTVACYESSALLLGSIPCDADVITEKVSGKYQMTVYPIQCGIGNVYLASFKEFTFCQYYGDVGSDACGPAEQQRWLFRNGNKGTWTWRLGAKMTDGSTVMASRQLTWT